VTVTRRIPEPHTSGTIDFTGSELIVRTRRAPTTSVRQVIANASRARYSRTKSSNDVSACRPSRSARSVCSRAGQVLTIRSTVADRGGSGAAERDRL